MGLSDIYSITVEGSKNFRAAIESEEKASYAWMSKWGWILDEYMAINREISKLKDVRKIKDNVTELEDNRTTRPYSETEGHEYGFLAKKPEFRLEIFSSAGLTPLPKKLSPALLYKLVDERMEEKTKKYFLDMVNLTPVSMDSAYREYLRSEERAAWLWHRKWSWLIAEYRKVYDELKSLQHMSPDSYRIIEEEADNRSGRPYPETTGHEYGYLSTKPEFALEKFSSQGLTPLKKSLQPRDLYRDLDERLTKRSGSSTFQQGYLDYYKSLSKKEEHFDLAMMTLI